MPTPIRSSSGGDATARPESGDHPSAEAESAQSRTARVRAMAAAKASEAASYVRERGFRGLTDDLLAAARKHPVAAIAVCLGIGYSIGRLTSRK